MGLAIGSLVLTPLFSATVLEYEAATTDATNIITATPADEAATVTILNGVTPVVNGEAATWAAGANTVTITVVSGGTTRTYTITVTKS